MFGFLRRREAPLGRRQTAQAVLEAQMSRATQPAVSGATAALEAASGLTARAFAAADITLPAYAGNAADPALLSLIGRQLVRRGEVVLLLSVTGGLATLTPASSWSIRGGWDRETWTYDVDLAGASVTTSYRGVSSDRVAHIIPQADPSAPWRGLTALESASLAGRLSAEVAGALADEAATARGGIMAAPIDPESEQAEALRTAISTAKGKLVVVESGDWAHSGATVPTWKSERFGARPDPELVKLHERAFDEVVAAIGIPLPLVGGRGYDSGSRREAYRVFLHSFVAPLGKVLSAEFGRVLAGDVRISWGELRAADIAGRMRAYGVGVNAGMSPERAEQLVGFADG